METLKCRQGEFSSEFLQIACIFFQRCMRSAQWLSISCESFIVSLGKKMQIVSGGCRLQDLEGMPYELLISMARHNGSN